MLDLVLLKVGDTHFMAVVLLSMGCAAGVLMALMPFLQTDNLARRMKDVSTERDRIRMRERERLAASQSKTSLRHKSGGITKTVTESLNLASWLNTDTAKQQLNQAGFRGAGAENAFLTFRFVAPILFFFVALIYVFFIAKLQWAFTFKVCAAIFAAYLGIKAPEIFLSNKKTKRQKSRGGPIRTWSTC